MSYMYPGPVPYKAWKVTTNTLNWALNGARAASRAIKDPRLKHECFATCFGLALHCRTWPALKLALLLCFCSCRILYGHMGRHVLLGGKYAGNCAYRYNSVKLNGQLAAKNSRSQRQARGSQFWSVLSGKANELCNPPTPTVLLWYNVGFRVTALLPALSVKAVLKDDGQEP